MSQRSPVSDDGDPGRSEGGIPTVWSVGRRHRERRRGGRRARLRRGCGVFGSVHLPVPTAVGLSRFVSSEKCFPPSGMRFHLCPSPDSPGHEGFPGKCFHSWEYRDPEAYRGMRVLVVGIGNSGGDIAVEISRSAEMVRKGEKVLYPVIKCSFEGTAVVFPSGRHSSAPGMGPGSSAGCPVGVFPWMLRISPGSNRSS